jgi:hypothetical protein
MFCIVDHSADGCERGRAFGRMELTCEAPA